jgi:hypothetical protein
MSFFKNKRQEGKIVPIWGLVWVRRRVYKERAKEGEYGESIM